MSRSRRMNRRMRHYDAFDDDAIEVEPRYRRSTSPSKESNAPTLADDASATVRQRAVVKWFHSHREFGFVAADNGDDAILFASELRKGGIDPDAVTTGTILEVVLAPSSRGFVANEISLVDRPAWHNKVNRDVGVVHRIVNGGAHGWARDAWGDSAFLGEKIISDLGLQEGDRISYEARPGSLGPFACNVVKEE